MPVPRSITPHVQEFCREITAKAEPIYLDVAAPAQAMLLDCFINVEKKIAESGGSPQYGWRIWEWTNTIIEAEFHAVWRSPDGTLVDVTPAPHDYERILFLPDEQMKYEGRQVDNIRKALFQSPLLEEFIQLWQEKFEIENRDERANMHGAILVEGADAVRLIAIQKRLAEIRALLSPCPCGSRLRFYRCCGH